MFNFEPPNGSNDGPYGDIVLPDRGSGRRAVLRRPRLLGRRRARSASARSAGSATSSGNQAPIAVGRGESHRGAGAARRQLLERGLVGSRRAAADVLVDVRRRHDLDRGQPEPHLRRNRVSTRRGSPSRTASTRRSRRRSRSASGARRRRPSSSPQDGSFFVAGDVIAFSGERNGPGRRDAARQRLHLEHRLPPRRPRASRARPIAASRAARSRSRRAVTTSAATPATASRSPSPTRPG